MYINSTNGAEVSVEEMQQYATEAGLGIEEYAAAAGFSLKSDEVKTKEAEKVDFPTSAAVDADVVQQPMTASQAEYVEPKDTELAPVDTSLDSPDPANEDFTLEQFKLMTPEEKNALSYSEKQRLSREKNNEKNNVLDEIESEASKKFKSGALRVGSNLAQIPAFINRLKMTTLIGIAGSAFEEDIEKFKNLDSKTQDIIAQSLGAFSGIADIGSAGAKGLEAAENLKNDAKKIEETLTKYDNTIGQDFIEGNISQAVSRTFNEVIGTIPSIAQAFVPYVGISSIVAGSAADYSTEALAEGKKLDAANMIAATATGFSEGLLELTTKKIGKGLFKSLAGKSKDVVSKTLKEAALQTAKEAGQEGLSESTTEVLNRSIDALYKNKGDEWDNIWPQLADVFIIGAAAGGGMSGSGNTASIINKAVQVNSVNRTLKENNSESVLNSFEKDPISRETINIAKNKYSGNILDVELKSKVSKGDISLEESKSIKQKFNVTRKNIQLTSDLKINENLIQETVGLLDERQSLSSEIAKAKGNKSLVETQQSRLNNIDSRLSEISAENKLSITTKTIEKLAKDVEGLTIKNLDNAEAIDNFIKENNLDIDSKKASNQQGFIYQNPETGDQTIIINKEVSTKEQAVNVAAHEFLHGLIFQTVKNSPETQLALGKSLNEYINKIDATQVKDSNFAKRLESYKDMDEATQSEEVLTLFSDAIATGDIQFNESVFTKIGDVIRRTLQNLGVKVKFNNGKDVYNFVKDYNKSIEKGVLTKAQKTVAKTGATGTLISEQVQESKPEIKESKQLTPEQDTQLRSDVAEINKEASEGEALAKKFNKDFVKGAKQTRLENKVLQEIKPIVDRVVTNRTKALYDPIAEDAKKNVSRQMFQESMRSDIESMVFDEFTGKQDLEKFIVNRAFLRANNLAERLGIKGVEEGITKGLEAAEKVAVEETTAPKADKPKYRNILKSNTLPTETITSIKNKVLKTVRTLKSKLDAKVSKNKTVTPLIAEIKKDMGKQADIDFKKAMGGKKDGQIKRFLIKNKKTILENMTTTWLMGAMPGAVQKQVDGSFTSDWQGKKIDREKTSTQQAGRTSGAEIVRRLPNAFKNLDDKTYLSYIIDESGAPIRGRKESLAKAMAEELSFDIFTTELQNEDSDIRKALEGNQEALGVVLADNYVQEVTRDVERGTVKFSKSALPYVGKLVKLGIKNGINEVVDVDGNILVNLPGLDDIDTTGLGSIVRKAFDIGLVPDGKELRFLQSIQGSKIIPQNIKDLVKRAITSKSELTVRTALAKDMVIVANSLGSDVTNIIGFDGLGFFNRLLDSAKTKIDKITRKIIPGAKGRFYDTKVDMIKNQPKSFGLPINYNEAEVSPMNSKTGVMGKISRILNKKDTAEQKMKEYEKLIPEIEAANVQNKILAKYIITKLVNLVQDGKISPKSFVSILQAQTNATAGLRSLTGLKYITFKDGPQGNMKGEHLADNGTSMFEIAELGFENNTKKELSFKIDGILEFHDQWLENRETLDFVDQFGKSNNNKDLRIRLLANKDQAFVYTYDLRPAEDLITERESAVKSRNALKKSIDFKELNIVETQQKAINNGRSTKFSKSPKKIRVFDFDDTLARTKSNVLYTMPDGRKEKIDAATFAKDAGKMEAEGAIFDFSEFSKVMDGKKGPLFEVAKKIADARGTEDVFVLTARPQDAAGPIQEFLKSLGLSIPLKNITGLSDGNPKAKADWMVGKVAEGYNDFYFADDAIKNVKAVKDIFDTFDIKGKVQQAKVKFSKSLDKDFNNMIERQTGTESFKEFSKGVAQRRGKKVGKFKVFVSPSAEDFRGLTQYKFAGKGKQGEADQKFFEEALMDPYFQGVAALETERQTVLNDTKGLFNVFKPVKKKLNKLVPGIDFTYDAAVRVFLWNKAGKEIPGLTKRDNKKLNDAVANDPELSAFADALLLVSKKDTWPDPSEYWESKTTLSDLNDLTDKTNRKEYLKEFIENVDIIFSEKNLNKVEALYGKASREAIENAIYAMKTGSNSPNQSGDGITNRWLQWVNNSIGTIMFFNRRSALLQLTSATNFLNWSDNNPAKAALAFANQPQYWKDWAMIFNSDKLKQRRSGLKSDVQESEIANAAKNTEDKIGSIIAYLLKIGFSPTQIADSIAISSGGATFYRNRVNSLLEKSGFKKPQVIFLTGAAGSGKTTAAKNFGKNWVIVNKDVEMEALMKEAGLPSDLNKLTREQRGEWQKIQEQASKNALAEIKKLKEQGKNIIIDDTGSSEATISGLKRELEKSGYESKMLLLGTSLEQSLERNKARKQRTLTDVTVKNSFEALMGNKKRYKEVFKDNFIEATDGKISDNLISELTGKISRKDAEAQAFEDFSKLSDEAQQSGDPALVSQQQRSVAGRLILSFQNTTMQYTRLMKKSGQDLINGRGDAKTHVSKILYYGALQNFIFNALSQTAFALIPGFDDDDDEDEVKRDEKLEEKATRVLNGMVDSIIRGTGIYGAVVTTLKNTIKTWEKEADKGFTGDQAKTLLEAANISPAIGSKLRKIYSAIQAYKFDKAVMEKHPWSVTIDGKFNPSPTFSIIANLSSATLNLPLDRALAEARGVAEAFDNRNSEMQRIALALGWRTWNVGAENEEFDLIKMEGKQQKKENKKAEKADFDIYRRKVFKVLTRSENSAYSQKKGALAKKEYILKLGKQKGIK